MDSSRSNDPAADVPDEERERLAETDPTNPARLPTDHTQREPELNGPGNLAAQDPDR